MREQITLYGEDSEEFARLRERVQAEEDRNITNAELVRRMQSVVDAEDLCIGKETSSYTGQ